MERKEERKKQNLIILRKEKNRIGKERKSKERNKNRRIRRKEKERHKNIKLFRKKEERKRMKNMERKKQ